MDVVLPLGVPVRAQRDRRPLIIAGYGLAAFATVAIAAAVGMDHPAGVALTRALMVGVPIGVGLAAWSRHERYGLVLVALGSVALVTALAESRDEVAYSVGRTAGWLYQALLVYAMLAFPTGRLTSRMDRLLFGGVLATLLTAFLPRLPLAGDFDLPSPFTSCTRDCPPNAFQLLDREPALVDAVIRPIGAVLVVCVMAGVAVRLGQRIVRASPLTRRMLAPVFGVAIAVATVTGAGFAIRELEPGVGSTQEATWLLALSGPSIALAYGAGALRWRLFAEDALQRLTECLRTLPDAPTLRRAFAEAFGDPTIEIVFPARGPDGGWMDSAGRLTRLPGPHSGRFVSDVVVHGDVVAALVHDAGLRAHPELVHAGVSLAGVVLDNQRLAAEADASIRELRRSRARLAAEAERERRRIERDLHDGAQQRLIALRIQLGLAEDLVRRDPEQGIARLQRLGCDLDDALEELRALAHGVYPPLLADRGLVAELRSVASRSAIPVAVEAHDVGRYPAEVESAVYFCLREALQNALKHARGAHRITVRLDGAGDALRFSLRDDGAGASDISRRAGRGIANMRDRLAAVGGAVEIRSAPGEGTAVLGYAPASAVLDP